jgi:hypothetical protein
MAALVAVGSLAVHQLRFLLWYGHHSDRALSAQGHSYLMVVGPAVVAVAVFAFARFLDRLARGARTSVPRLGRLWLVLSGTLAGMFCVQETLEGMLSSGHPDGLAAIAGHGGWIAAPLSAAVGLALAVALRGGAQAAELLSPGRSPHLPLPAAPLSLHPLVTPPPRREPWLAVASARAPPAASA